MVPVCIYRALASAGKMWYSFSQVVIQMINIADIDPNFKVETKIDRQNITFHDVKQLPFEIYGVFYENGKFRRLPEAVAKTVSDSVYKLQSHTAGGRVRFKTDSSRIAIHVDMPSVRKMSHFPLTGSVGLDMYIRDGGEERFEKTFVPPFDVVNGFESLHEFALPKLREITINLPLYSEVANLYIGIDKDAKLYPPEPYANEKPIVYYGSSITQGGCASRPGNSYESIVARRLNVDYINLGFSGSAKAEPEIAAYIRDLPMSVFVYDYDHNAKTVDYLRQTHETMFQTIRRANPELPIVIMSRPKYTLSPSEEERLEVIRATYENAKSQGDKHVYLIDGKTLMGLAGNDGTVDNAHPNDFGFASMAKAVGDVLAQILHVQ